MENIYPRAIEVINQGAYAEVFLHWQGLPLLSHLMWRPPWGGKESHWLSHLMWRPPWGGKESHWPNAREAHDAAVLEIRRIEEQSGPPVVLIEKNEPLLAEVLSLRGRI